MAWMVSLDARLILALLLFVLTPGAAAAVALRSPTAMAWSAQLAIWLGVSISLIALLYEWLNVFDLAVLPPTPALLLLLCAIGLIVLAWKQVPTLKFAPGRIALLMSSGLVLLFAVTVALRFFQIRELVLPAWVDSLHHAVLIRIVAETGRIPLTLEPYLPVARLPYHWGYHVLSALALQAAGVPLPEALPQGMLWYGQILSALMVPAYAGLAAYLWRRPVAGIVAGLTVGLLSVMPAYYVSWGRYTLLSGLLMLPAALMSSRGAVQQPTPRRMILASIALAGLSLVHFVVFVFALLWCLALIVTERPKQWPVLLALGGGAGLLTLPWLGFIASQAQLGAGAAATYVAGNVSYNALPFELLWASNNQILLLLSGLSALVCYRRRRAEAALIAIWSALVVLLANPTVLGLPYLSFITNETVVICLFVPCALLLSGAAALLLESAWLRIHPYPALRSAGILLTVILTAALIMWGVWTSRSIVRQDTILATRDDLAAIQWAAQHTPRQARFLVNTVGWLGSVDRGADGGWWLLPLAERQVSTPPVLYTYADTTTVEAIQQTTAWLRQTSTATDTQLAAFMQAYGFMYAYAVVDGQPLDATKLRNSPLFELVYDNGRVTILRLR